ncbi:mechanosensitive ion channel domain-containing protein [uncultured Porphyromonas sp.]|uniref:mechanosensitive ion channel family protein n=1 Tax=uncultured Porphyromonas sp. TaxID=159274 RepID=UPI00261CCAF6|nr:mechanosensitive ion channel domain-containing protein [uncultured Porphyromonas sp.]
MALPLLSAVLPADSTAASQVTSALGTATQPLELDVNNWFSRAMMNDWLNSGINFGIRVVLAILLFLIGRWVIRRLLRIFERILKRREIDGVAVTLLGSVLTALLYIALFLTLGGVLGVKSVSFAAVLASMGLAVGMALSGQLQNLAGGVIIMVTKPFSIGDYILAQTAEGSVRAVSLFYTEILTPDNKCIFIPNGVLSSGVVVNYSHEETRRIEWTIGIEYDEDFARVRSAIESLLESDERVLKTPEPTIVLHNLNSSSVDVLVRAWVRSEDLWPVFWDFNRRMYEDFNKRGISFPFPQLTVHQGK